MANNTIRDVHYCQWTNRILKVVFFPLLANSLILWVVNTTLIDDNWKCIVCRADGDPSLAQQFLFYSVWSLWLTSLVFYPWAIPCCRDAKKISQTVFQIAFPHAATFMTTYIYYVATNPADEYVDREACYYLGRSFLSRDLGKGNDDIINLYLVLMTVSDLTVHYLSFPLLLYLWITGQVKFQVLFPWSTVFVFLLSAVIAPVQIFMGVTIYCGGLWFNLIGSVAINFIYHVFFALMSRRKIKICGRCCGGHCLLSDHDDDTNEDPEDKVSDDPDTTRNDDV